MRKAKTILYVKRVVSKGKPYWYFDTGVKEASGKPIRKPLPPPSDPSFGTKYAALMAGRERRLNVRTELLLPDFVRQFENSPELRGKALSTQRTYEIYLRIVVDQLAAAPVNRLERSDVLKLRDRVHAGEPAVFGGASDRGGSGAANGLVRAVGALFAWGRKRGITENDPRRGIELFPSEDYEPWPDALLEDALASDDPLVSHPVGLLYFTAQRIGDVCKMRWNAVRNGEISVVQEKTGTELWIPLHRDLAVLVNNIPKRGMTVLTDAQGRQMTPAAIRRHLQAFAHERGYTPDKKPKIVPHGLRKNAVISLLEVGCSVAEVSSVSGQTLQQVEHYAKRRSPRKLAKAAILKWEGGKA